MRDASFGRTDDRRPDRAVVVIAIALLALAGLVAYDAWSAPSRRVLYGLSPTTVPYFIAAGLAVLGAATLAVAFKRSFPARDNDELVPVLLIVGGLIAQLALLKVAGFSVATGLLFAATARAMGRGPLFLTVPIGVALSFAVWVIFSQLLNLSLPAGPIERAYLVGQTALFQEAPATAPAPAAPAAPSDLAPAPAPAPAAPQNGS